MRTIPSKQFVVYNLNRPRHGIQFRHHSKAQITKYINQQMDPKQLNIQLKNALKFGFNFEIPKYNTVQKPTKIGGMQFFPTLNIFKSNAGKNCLDLDTLTATSYNWWIFVKKIGKQIVFNDYIYSNCTSKHQSKVRRVLNFLNIKYVSVECPKGLQNLQSGIDRHVYTIEKLEKLMKTPKTHKRKNIERTKEIVELKLKIKVIKKLQSIETPKTSKEKFDQKFNNFVK